MDGPTPNLADNPISGPLGANMTVTLKSAVLAALLAVGAPWATAGEVREDQRAPSAALEGEIAYSIYLPNGHSEPGARFPVIYVLHGFGGGQREWFHGGRLKETLDRLIDAGAHKRELVLLRQRQT